LRLIVLAVAIAAATVAFAFRRWVLWAIIRYRQARTLAAWRALVAEYLAGRISLDPAAAKYNQIEARFHRYGFRATDLQPGGPSYLRSISLAPPGYRVDDPRLDALIEHASLLHFGPQRYAEIRASMRKQREADGLSQPGGPT
jgi:hypothetical protein